jgi:hypothetical protein
MSYIKNKHPVFVCNAVAGNMISASMALRFKLLKLHDSGFTGHPHNIENKWGCQAGKRGREFKVQDDLIRRALELIP